MNLIKGNRWGFLALGLGILFVIIGALRGEIAVVLSRAAAICLECVGIG